MDFVASVLTFACITVIAVTGIFVLTGLTGLFSLGQAAFMGIGAYVAGVLVVNYQVPFLLAAVLAILVGMFIGLIVGLPTIRLRRDYIALVTFGFGEAITALLNQSVNLTGGAMGMSGIPQITTLPIALGSAIVCLFLVRNFKYSKYGRQALALRGDELAARAMGINVTRIKLISFLFATAITTYAGVLYAFYTSYVEPAMFGWTKSAEWIIIVFLGGINSLTGSVVAALFLVGLPEILRFASEYRIAIYSILVIFVLNFRPSGIFGEYELSLTSLRRLILREKKDVV